MPLHLRSPRIPFFTGNEVISTPQTTDAEVPFLRGCFLQPLLWPSAGTFTVHFGKPQERFQVLEVWFRELPIMVLKEWVGRRKGEDETAWGPPITQLPMGLRTSLPAGSRVSCAAADADSTAARTIQHMERITTEAGTSSFWIHWTKRDKNTQWRFSSSHLPIFLWVSLWLQVAMSQMRRLTWHL